MINSLLLIILGSALAVDGTYTYYDSTGFVVLPGGDRTINLFGAGLYWGQSLTKIKEVHIYGSGDWAANQILFHNSDPTLPAAVPLIPAGQSGHEWGTSQAAPIVFSEASGTAAPGATVAADVGPYTGTGYDLTGVGPPGHCGYGTTTSLQLLNGHASCSFVLFYIKVVIEYDVNTVNSCTVPAANLRGDFNFNGWLDLDFDYIRYRRV